MKRRVEPADTLVGDMHRAARDLVARAMERGPRRAASAADAELAAQLTRLPRSEDAPR